MLECADILPNTGGRTLLALSRSSPFFRHFLRVNPHQHSCALFCLGLLVAVLALDGCATSGKNGGYREETSAHQLSGIHNSAWLLKNLAQIEEPRILLLNEQMPIGLVEIAPIRAGWESADRLLNVACVGKPHIIVIPGEPANAFTMSQDNVLVVAVNFAMVEQLGEDKDAWAALLGHEFAHIELNHIDMRKKRQVDEIRRGNLIGIALTVLGVPLGSWVAQGSTTLVERGFSRDDERDADRVGVEMMVRAGFDPEGAVRMQSQLAKVGTDSGLSFLNSHPGGEERVVAMRELVRKYSGKIESESTSLVDRDRHHDECANRLSKQSESAPLANPTQSRPTSNKVSKRQSASDSPDIFDSLFHLLTGEAAGTSN